MLCDLARKTRSYRRFLTSKLITDEDLTSILDVARCSASAGNLQRLRYATLRGEYAERAFSAVSLGGYLPKEKKPSSDVAATAYIVILSGIETPDVNLAIDIGIAAEAIALAAAERGIGSCMIRNFDKSYFSDVCGTDGLFVHLVIALGYPAEESKIVDPIAENELKYYINEDGVNIVPKLPLDTVWVLDKQ